MLLGPTLLSFFKLVADTRRVPPAVKNCHDGDQLSVQQVVNRIGKTLREGSVEATIGLWMDAGVKYEGVDVGEKAIDKIGSDPRRLSLVKGVTVLQVSLGGASQENFHLLLGDLVLNAYFCITPG